MSVQINTSLLVKKKIKVKIKSKKQTAKPPFFSEKEASEIRHIKKGAKEIALYRPKKLERIIGQLSSQGKSLNV